MFFKLKILCLSSSGSHDTFIDSKVNFKEEISKLCGFSSNSKKVSKCNVTPSIFKSFFNYFQVHVLRKDGRTVPKGKGKRKLRGDTDLIYLRATRPTCNNQGRVCHHGNHDVVRGDLQTATGCDRLCCGKGHRTVSKVVESPCRCKFSWCCEVNCQLCNSTVTQNVCN